MTFGPKVHGNACPLICIVALFSVCGAPASAAEPNPLLLGLEPGTALYLGEYVCNQRPTDQPCKGITDFSRFNYDARRHQLLMFGGGHAATFRDDVDVFDFKTLTWTPAYAPTPCAEMTLDNLDPALGIWKSTGHPLARHTYDMMVVVEDELIMLDQVLGRGGCAPSLTNPNGGPAPYFAPGKIQHYDIVGNLWRQSNVDAGGLWHYTAAAEYDPVSRKIIILGPRRSAGYPGMWIYDPFSSPRRAVEVPIKVPARLDGEGNLVYFPPNQRMYFFSRKGPIFEVALGRGTDDFSRTRISEIHPVGTPPLPGQTGFAFDPVNSLIGGGVRDGLFFTFDPQDGTWTSRLAKSAGGEAVGTLVFHALDYDTVDNVYIFIANNGTGMKTWAYRFGGEPVRPSSPEDLDAD